MNRGNLPVRLTEVKPMTTMRPLLFAIGVSAAGACAIMLLPASSSSEDVGSASAIAPVVPVSAVAFAPIKAASLSAGDRIIPVAAGNDSATTNSGSDEGARKAPALEIGDKITLLVYEKLSDAELNKWGRYDGAESGFQQRPEMSGEFTVGDDGTISVPMLGTFSTVDSTPQQLRAALEVAYKKLMHRTAFVTITSLIRPPIYVLGPVKTPGKFEYTPNMTVLQAIALAGGIKTSENEPGTMQRIEKVREILNRRAALEIMADLYAREAVLEAERDQVAPDAPATLIQLVGETKARQMIAAAAGRRRAIVEARRSQRQGVDDQLQAARQQVKLLSDTNLQTLDNVIELHERRLVALRRLSYGGNANNLQVLNAETELQNAKARRDDVVNRLTQAKQQVGQFEQQNAQFAATQRSDLDTALLSLRQQIADNEQRNMASEGVLATMNGTGTMEVAYSTDSGKNGVPHWTFEIVRQTPNGHVQFTAEGITTLIPGDLVRIVLLTSADASPDAIPGPYKHQVPIRAPVQDKSASLK